MLIDTHAHIQFQGYNNDREEVIKRCQDKGMILNLVGTQKDTSRLAVELAEKYDWMYATIGTHPIHLFPTHVDEEESHFTSREERFDEAYYEELVKSKKVIGIGEIGLDAFHLPPDVPKETVIAKQAEVFLAQFRFAQKHQLAVAIHCRDAHDEMIEILKSKVASDKLQVRGVIHCYTSNWAHAEEYLKLGFCLGFTGVITFPARKTNPEVQEKLLEVVKNIPLDRVVVETDSPYLAPQAYRGQRAEPWMVEEVVKKIAKIKELPVSEVEKAIEANTRKLFLI